MDSTKSDIAVIKNGILDFYIEAKDAFAQSGQFVLLPNEMNQTFMFSPRNHSTPNAMTDIIIKYMNNNFQKFNHAGTAGQSLEIDSNIFSNWIIEYYKAKNVKYVISFNKEFVIFPIRKFKHYFNISAKYRIKKSGSREPAKKELEIVKLTIKKLYPTAVFSQEQDKLFVKITESLTTNKFILGDYTFYFSKYNADSYEIRKLSNTYNMNVIFSIKLIQSQDINDLKEFESDLGNN